MALLNNQMVTLNNWINIISMGYQMGYINNSWIYDI